MTGDKVKIRILTNGGYYGFDGVELPQVVDAVPHNERLNLFIVEVKSIKGFPPSGYDYSVSFSVNDGECEIVDECETVRSNAREET